MSTQAATLTQPVAAVRRSPASGSLLAAVAAILATGLYLATAFNPRQAALFLVGIGAGIVLYHAAFGFTSSFRVFISDRKGAGLRAQMLMLALTCAVFFPLLSAGSLFGQPLRGNVSPAGTAVTAGAFIFGIGMQLGGGCASGTLFSVGGGNLRMAVTLLMFIVGSLIGTAHVPWWTAQPSFAPMSMVTTYGVVIALLMNAVIFGGIWAATVVLERKRHGGVESVRTPPRPSENRWLRGPWPLAAGAIGLAVVNIATLTIAGRPWGITSAFALWGAKAAAAIGIPVGTWQYWATPAQVAALNAPVLADITTVMDIGIILGAVLAAMLANRFAPSWKASGRSLAAAVIGGLLLGYGARLAYGCNIGAYFSGVASGSPHGWLWLVAALAGNAVGVKLRPFCDLPVERSRRPAEGSLRS